jgi:hypothetical protein
MLVAMSVVLRKRCKALQDSGNVVSQIVGRSAINGGRLLGISKYQS